jgi:hypothetical protein
MINQSELRHAVDMQQRSYLLLKWMASAVKSGFIGFQTAHQYSTLSSAAEGWIRGHYLNIPADARPLRDDLPAFAAFFSTYLTNSFDLIANPGKHLYSPEAHCFCPMCSWLVDAPNLKAKKISSADKRRAEKIKARTLMQIATENRIPLSESLLMKVIDDPENREDVALIAYGYDLLQRLKGIANGPAILVLWRGFAWSEAGSPKKKFRLKEDVIVNAEKRMIETMRKAQPN